MSDVINNLTYPGQLLPPLHLVSFVDYPPAVRGYFHSHPSYQTTLVLTGTCLFHRPDGEVLAVDPHEVGIIPPNLVHDWGTAPGAECHTFMVMHERLSVEQYGDVAIHFSATSDESWWKVKLDPARYESLLENIRPECTALQAGSSAMLTGYFTALLAEISRNAQQQYGYISEQDQAILQALKYIECHFQEPCALTVLAQQTHLGVSRFSQLFRAYTGMAPMHYLVMYRIKRAMVLLAYSHLDISQIARQTGFQSVHYFSRLFKSQVGCSPSEYRQRQTMVSL